MYVEKKSFFSKADLNELSKFKFFQRTFKGKWEKIFKNLKLNSQHSFVSTVFKKISMQISRTKHTKNY